MPLAPSTPSAQLGRYFDIEGRNTYLTAEIRGGIVAFLTISYIIAGAWVDVGVEVPTSRKLCWLRRPYILL